MRRILATALLMALVGPATANADQSGRCWPKGSRTVAATKDVRVYYRGAVDHHSRYACAMRTGRRWRLGIFTTSSYGPGVVNVQIGGHFVGYNYVNCSESCEDSDVRVLDTRTGRVRRSPKARPGFDGISGLVVLRTGKVAYIARYPDQLEVHLFSGTTDRVIDAGPGVERNSLAVAGTTLYWMRDGVAQSLRT